MTTIASIEIFGVDFISAVRTRVKVYHPQRKRKRLPWLRCLHCGRRLVQIDVVERQTCIHAGLGIATKMKLVCPGCGTIRTFESHPCV